MTQRSILITGCSDGSLGSALALAFHKAGWRVFASARNLSKLKEAQAAGIETIQLDVTSDESIASGVSQLSELTGGSLDTLLNNAGAGYSMPLMDLDIAETRKLFDLNVFSIISVTRSFLPLLLKSTHGGLVVNNTSLSSLTVGAMPFSGAYNSSKAAATSLTDTLRLELAPFGVKVVNMVTGAVRSNFFSNATGRTLPSTSLFNVAKETVEKALTGDETVANATDTKEWADQVVRDLGSPNPSYWIWRGKYSLVVRIGSLLPVGFLDSIVKKQVGLDVVENKIKEQGGLKKLISKLTW